MSFRRRLALIAGLFFGILGASSCGMRFDPLRGGKNQQALPVASDAQSTGCLTGAAEQLSRFWNGKALNSEIEKLWTCASDSLDLFLARARGSRPGVFTPKELRSFLQTYFLQDMVVSDELLNEAMAIKQLFIGGSRSYVTTQDIRKTKKIIEVIKRTSLDLLPYMPMPFSHSDGEMTEDRAFQIYQIMRNGANGILSSLEQSNADYPLDRLFGLVEQLDRLPRSVPNEESAIFWLKGKLPLIRALKVAFVGGKGEPREPMSSAQWAHFMRTAVDGYSLYIRLLYLTQQFRLQEYPVGYVGSTRERFYNWAEDVLVLLESAASKRSDRVIPYASIEEGLQQVPWKAKFGLDPAAVFRLMRAMNEHFLQSGSARGVTATTIRNIRLILSEWSNGQQALEANFKIKDTELDYPVGGGGSADRFRVGGIMRLSSPTNFGAASSSAQSTDLNEFVFLRPRSLFAENKSELAFPGATVKTPHSFFEMSQVNWMLQMSKTLIRAYGENPSNGGRVTDLRRFYTDMREVGIQLKIFDPTDDRVPEKRFREANLFLPSSDGNAWLSIKEGMELIAYMVSTKVIMSRIHHDLTSRDKCGKSKTLDIYGWSVIDADCFRKNFYSNFRNYFPNWPLLSRFVDSLKTVERSDYIVRLELAARKNNPAPTDPIISGDLESIIAILQYVETLFQRFDHNDDGVLDSDEAELAFPVFRSTIRDVFAKVNPSFNANEEDLKSALRYLLVEGHAPSAKDFFLWRYLGGDRLNKVQADRAKLVAIFAEVSSSL